MDVINEVSSTYREWRCDRCRAQVNSLKADQAFMNASMDQCINFVGYRCGQTLNATEAKQCLQVAATVCSEVMGESIDSCEVTGQCNLNDDPPYAFIFGECGACEHLFEWGLDKTESFVCHGLAGAISSACQAAAPICEEALDIACKFVIHDVCSNSCMATWICHEFHACSDAPSSPCCHV